jgi:hypothetical protein
MAFIRAIFKARLACVCVRLRLSQHSRHAHVMCGAKGGGADCTVCSMRVAAAPARHRRNPCKGGRPNAVQLCSFSLFRRTVCWLPCSTRTPSEAESGLPPGIYCNPAPPPFCDAPKGQRRTLARPLVCRPQNEDTCSAHRLRAARPAPPLRPTPDGLETPGALRPAAGWRLSPPPSFDHRRLAQPAEAMSRHPSSLMVCAAAGCSSSGRAGSSHAHLSAKLVPHDCPQSTPGRESASPGHPVVLSACYASEPADRAAPPRMGPPAWPICEPPSPSRLSC